MFPGCTVVDDAIVCVMRCRPSIKSTGRQGPSWASGCENRVVELDGVIDCIEIYDLVDVGRFAEWRIEAEAIRADASGEAVVACTTVDPIVARTAVQSVGAHASLQRISAPSAL